MVTAAITLRGKSTTQSYRQPVYCVDLTLKDGVNLHKAIQMEKDIDSQSKATGVNQSSLDEAAWQGFSNARFEVNSEEGLDLVEEFYQKEEQRRLEVQNSSFSIQRELNATVT